MSFDKKKTDSFTEVLGNSLRTAAPQSFKNNIKGIGSTDTAIRNCRIVALVDDKHFDVMGRQKLNHIPDISSFHNQYMLDDAPLMLEDTKSHAGDAYSQPEYIAVTVERATGPQNAYGMVAKAR